MAPNGVKRRKQRQRHQTASNGANDVDASVTKNGVDANVTKNGVDASVTATCDGDVRWRRTMAMFTL
jgi:hypothetical protein